MAGLLGKLEEFDDSQDWVEFMEHLEQHFVVNGIEHDKKRAILLTICGSKTYSRIRNTVLPDKPKYKSYDQLVQLVKDHVCPDPFVIAERFKYHQHNQWGTSDRLYLCVTKIGRNMLFWKIYGTGFI